MMKKQNQLHAILSLLFVAFMPLKLLATVYTGSCGTNATYTLDNDAGTLTISGSGPMKNYAPSTTPPWYSRRSDIKKIVIEEGITSIGEYAFWGCNLLEAVDFSNSVISVGRYAFASCTSLPVENNLRYAGVYLVGAVNKISTYTIKPGTRFLGNQAFYNCNTLASVVIPESVISIGDEAFRGCSSLASVIIPEGVTSIGDYVFSSCYSLTSANVPESVTNIGKYAFANCYALTSANIPEGVTRINDSAFTFCYSLTRIIIPEGVSSISNNAFTGCYFANDNFVNNSNLSGESNKFWGATITDSELDNGLLIKDNVVVKCRSWVKSVEIPNYITSIAISAFNKCTDLISVIIPESVTSIENNAFPESLNEVRCNSLIPPSIGSSTFSKYGSLYVPAGGKVIYSNKPYWRNFTIIEDEPSPEDLIGSDCLEYIFSSNGTASVKNPSSGNEYAGDIVIPKMVVKNGFTYRVDIGASAFSGCTSLLSVKIPEGVINIGDYAFSGCYLLNSINIPTGVTSIGRYAFNWCSSLASVTIPSTVTTINNEAFFGCYFLRENFVNNSSLSSEDNHYWDAEFVDNELANGLLFKENVLVRCRPWATSVEIPHYVTKVEKFAFKGCSALASITIPDGVTSIGSYAFDGCSSLTFVSLSENVRYIYNNAFRGCSKLTSMYCYAKMKPSASEQFLPDEIANAILYVPAESVEAYKAAQYWKDFGAILPILPTLDVTLVDGENYGIIEEKGVQKLNYVRNFTNTNWQALYVPFAMSYDDWKDDFEVARLNDVHQFDNNGDGVIDKTALEYIKLKEGSRTEPNTPYLIKAKQTGEKTITLENATLYPTVENSFDVTSWFIKFTFWGNYSIISNMATNGYYAMAGGGLKQATSDDVTLKPFRWYLDVTDRNDNRISLNAKEIILSFDDDEVTKIDEVPTNPSGNTPSIYTLSGINVGKNKASLPKGLYFRNGKKILVK